ncbi:Dol-P-Glc:Glc(2)Man(9)GlcNAc(2)-PP-Dol alpha-1,2-glucosyltransferase, partial [Sporobolomyces salmoneus]|uniref:Dol-P-Glc:Glc(2)Man(9)GlcNAc(2)-PP-Dol alpha-1,2-glucosyltransferase n=1 Tax=Sporobolomyces salmoneus TaxID=183962 RepID=UPI00317ED010
MALSSKLYWSTYALWISALVGIARRINQEVTESYMDEIFHVPQAQAYCAGDWRYWNGAITTPPGLYLLPAILSNIQQHLPRYFSRFNLCSLDSLRFFNLSILALLPLLYTSLLLALRTSIASAQKQKFTTTTTKEREENRNSARWEGLTIALMPVLGWWGWLYYTDLGSVATVLLSMRLSLGKRWFLSSFVGAISLLFRQTNIVWVAFIAGVGIARELRTGNSSKKTKSQLYDPLLPDARLIDLVLTPYSLAYLSLHNISTIVPSLTAYLPVFLGFLAFIKLNGGIVLGDKSNHVATIHIPQIYYFIAFSAVFFSPHLLDPAKIKKTLSSLFGSKRRVATSLNALVVMCWTVRNFTIAHPFLLADNRHFAFYLWRRVLNIHPLARYLLTPVYLIASRLVYQAL